MSILSVDPGVNTGWAFFRLARHRPDVLATGSIFGGKYGKPWSLRAQGVTKEFHNVLITMAPAQVWLEQPKAISSTSSLSGSQFKLDAIFGMLVGVCIVRKVPWFMIRIRDWKGQVPKEVSTQRTKVAMGLNHGLNAQRSERERARLPDWYPRSEHSWDALGLAVYVNNHNGKPPRNES